ncbi:hypothetical protein Nepgr_033311 [Nepenthes gracilis]|uniref:Uncharacterized protein n=1 Tax=Nepenthes gracilis TaxID=150966 RepID=A0AAD3Y6U0_NEPGR|nr:hypothetical protein Nepgr_033311 [Nepenthes gracilis]
MRGINTATCTFDLLLMQTIRTLKEDHIIIRRSGPSCHGVLDDLHGGDQCSCTSLGKLRQSLAELRKQFDVSRTRAIEDSSNLGSGQVGSVKNLSPQRRHKFTPTNPKGTVC